MRQEFLQYNPNCKHLNKTLDSIIEEDKKSIDDITKLFVSKNMVDSRHSSALSSLKKPKSFIKMNGVSPEAYVCKVEQYHHITGPEMDPDWAKDPENLLGKEIVIYKIPGRLIVVKGVRAEIVGYGRKDLTQNIIDLVFFHITPEIGDALFGGKMDKAFDGWPARVAQEDGGKLMPGLDLETKILYLNTDCFEFA